MVVGIEGSRCRRCL